MTCTRKALPVPGSRDTPKTRVGETVMEIMLTGVRGSTATPSQGMSFYGGNTACVTARTRNGLLLFFDAGTGLCEAFEGLPAAGECHIFISHGHADHIQGMGFFPPLHMPSWTIRLYFPEWLEDTLEAYFAPGIFPVPLGEFKGNIIRRPMRAGDVIRIPDGAGEATVEALEANHPGGCLAYRFHADGSVFLYTGDHEITDDSAVHEATRAMLRGADIAVVDAMYRASDYRPGWGHSRWEDWRDIAAGSGAQCLILTHHAPHRTDGELDTLQNEALAHLDEGEPLLWFAREGMRVTLPSERAVLLRDMELKSDWLERFLDDLARYQDESTLLDRILAKAREICNADAGTVFLRDGDELLFSYTHNDSLFSVDSAHKYAYSGIRLPVSTASIAGYAAVTGEMLNIPDVRALPPEAPYAFQPGFDDSTGYRTRTMLTVPFYNQAGEVSGVMQLINSLDPGTGTPRPFTLAMERNIRVLAREIANILKRSDLVRQGLYRTIRLTAVHDPLETGPHAERVGAIAAALYQTRANKLELDPDTTRYEKSRIRLAAMLHDVGKVGVSDLVLKKPGRLTDEEMHAMRAHTEIGAAVLDDEAKNESFMALARDISLHHHQKWNGQGYVGPGDAGRLSGEDIPIAARITALADVFDALVSPRSYKAPWPFEKAMNLLREEAGEHFDPMLVACMEEILDMVAGIYERFPDNVPEKPDEVPARG